MVLAATSQWIGLDPLESGLLTHLVPVFAPTGMCDVPIYLPISSPTTPVRLLAAELAPGELPDWTCLEALKDAQKYGAYRAGTGPVLPTLHCLQ